MILVCDTNVLSEVMRTEPHPGVRSWLADQPLGSLYTTTVTRMEILLGIALLPEGRRRDRLHAAVHDLFAQEFGGRLLGFDAAAADLCAEIRAERRRAGEPISLEDAMIAAITRANGGAVVTRDARGFQGCGVPILDPWARDSDV